MLPSLVIYIKCWLVPNFPAYCNPVHKEKKLARCVHHSQQEYLWYCHYFSTFPLLVFTPYLIHAYNLHLQTDVVASSITQVFDLITSKAVCALTLIVLNTPCGSNSLLALYSLFWFLWQKTIAPPKCQQIQIYEKHFLFTFGGAIVFWL